MRRPVIAFAFFAFLASGPSVAHAGPGDSGGRGSQLFDVTLSADHTHYVGGCPVTIKFTGQITGSPGRSLQYQFVRVVAGATTAASPLPGALDLAGKLGVVDLIAVDSAHAGAGSNTLYARPGTSKATVSFSVTCVTTTPNPLPTSTGRPGRLSRFGINPNVLATPTPTPGTPNRFGVLNGSVAPMLEALPAPYALRNTTDPGVCADHFPVPLFGGLVCAAGIKDGIVLIWDWKPSLACIGCITDVDGYRLYRVDAGRHDLVSKVDQGTATTAHAVTTPSDGFAGKCYAVSAYKGSTESHDSRNFCVAGATFGTQTQTFSPVYTRSSVHDETHQTGALCSGWYHDRSYSESSVRVEYAYNSASNWPCTVHYNVYSHGAVYFDLSSIAGKKVWKATLHLGGLGSRHEPKIPNDQPTYYFNDGSSYSCVEAIGLGKTDWWANKAWIEMDEFDYPSHHNPYDVVVTNQVSRWLTGSSSNFGFVMRPAEEGDKELDYKFACDTGIGSPTLTVEYFP